MKTTEETQQAKEALEQSISDTIDQFVRDNPGYDVSMTAACTWQDWGPGDRNRLLYVTAKATLTLLPAEPVTA